MVAPDVSRHGTARVEGCLTFPVEDNPRSRVGQTHHRYHKIHVVLHALLEYWNKNKQINS